jgi:hypothetical protein
VDIHFTGQFGLERLPLLHLPFNINKPRTYNVQPRPLTTEEKEERKETKEKERKEEKDSNYKPTLDLNSNIISNPDSNLISSPNSSSPKSKPKSSLNPDRFQCVILEPIVEEVYENLRYHPLTGRWRPPFLPGDPPEWTDASGTVRKAIQSIQIETDKWEWSGQWAVDMDTFEKDAVG